MNIRYYFEHVLLRKSYQKDPVKVINKLLTEKENYIYDLIFNAYSDANEPFPFSKADFSVSIEQFDQYEFIIINMPTNNLDTANCTQIILVYSMLLSMYEYFTVEYGKNLWPFDSKVYEYKCLCSWMEDSHINYGNISDDTNVIEKIANSLSI